MSRIMRLVRQQPDEDVWIVAGENGVVTAYLREGRTRSIFLHSPREVPGWTTRGRKCAWMEMTCWHLSSICDEELDEALLDAYGAYPDEENLWHLLEQDYWLYLAGTR